MILHKKPVYCEKLKNGKWLHVGILNAPIHLDERMPEAEEDSRMVERYVMLHKRAATEATRVLKLMRAEADKWKRDEALGMLTYLTFHENLVAIAATYEQDVQIHLLDALAQMDY